jgi:hypothetical protein
MKVLLYTVFKELAASDFVARGLMCHSTLRPLAPRRSLRFGSDLLENVCQKQSVVALEGTSPASRTRGRRHDGEVRSLKAEQCSTDPDALRQAQGDRSLVNPHCGSRAKTLSLRPYARVER